LTAPPTAPALAPMGVAVLIRGGVMGRHGAQLRRPARRARLEGGSRESCRGKQPHGWRLAASRALCRPRQPAECGAALAPAAAHLRRRCRLGAVLCFFNLQFLLLSHLLLPSKLDYLMSQGCVRWGVQADRSGAGQRQS
jgi:hypothetical protein